MFFYYRPNFNIINIFLLNDIKKISEIIPLKYIIPKIINPFLNLSGSFFYCINMYVKHKMNIKADNLIIFF